MDDGLGLSYTLYMSKRNTVSAKQAHMLSVLARRKSIGSIMELVQASDGYGTMHRRGHAAGYLRVHRLAKRGFIELLPIAKGNRLVVSITPKGVKAAS